MAKEVATEVAPEGGGGEVVVVKSAEASGVGMEAVRARRQPRRWR